MAVSEGNRGTFRRLRTWAVALTLTPCVGARALPADIYITTDPGGFLGYWGPDVFQFQSVGVRFTPAQDCTFDSAGLWFMNNDFDGNVHALVRVTLRPDHVPTPGQSIPSNEVIEEMFLTVTTSGWNPVLETVVSSLRPKLCSGVHYWLVAESDAPPGVNGVWVNAGDSTGFATTTTNQGEWQPGGMGAVPATRVFGTLLAVGDVDGNGTTEPADILRFVQALLGSPIHPADTQRSDTNCDGVANGLDVQGFVTAVLN